MAREKEEVRMRTCPRVSCTTLRVQEGGVIQFRCHLELRVGVEGGVGLEREIERKSLKMRLVKFCKVW